MKTLLRILIILLYLIMLAFPVFCSAFEVDLAWDASSSQDVKEYIVHYDTISGDPKGNSVTAGDVLQFTVTGLPDGVMHFFHITCKDWEGLESGPSNEVQTDGIDTSDSGENPMAPGGCYIVTIRP